MRLDQLWWKSTEDTSDSMNGSCSHEACLDSSIDDIINNEEEKIKELRLHVNLTHRIVSLRQQLDRIRLESKKIFLTFAESIAKSQEHLTYLSTIYSARVKKKHPMSLYRKALTTVYDDVNEGEKGTIPPPYVFDQQAKLLEAFHRTEIFRSQWEILSNHLVHTTQQLMHEKSRLKDPSIELEFERRPIYFKTSEQDFSSTSGKEEENKTLQAERNSSVSEESINENRGKAKETFPGEEKKMELNDAELHEDRSMDEVPILSENQESNGFSAQADFGKKQAALLWGEDGRKETKDKC